jgi:hypothetical protein
MAASTSVTLEGHPCNFSPNLFMIRIPKKRFPVLERKEVGTMRPDASAAA